MFSFHNQEPTTVCTGDTIALIFRSFSTRIAGKEMMEKERHVISGNVMSSRQSVTINGMVLLVSLLHLPVSWL